MSKVANTVIQHDEDDQKKTYFIFFFFFSGDSPYFAGGYITQIHSKDHFDAIQLETPRDLRIDKGDDERERFGHALGRAICDFYEFHYMN